MVEVELQNLLDQTEKRILQHQKETIHTFEADSVNNVIFYGKVGIRWEHWPC